MTMTIADVVAARTGHDGTVAAQNGPRAGQAKRRTFTAEYKLRVLDEYENAESPRERAALMLRDVEGLPAEEVAKRLDCSKATVRSHIANARIKLRKFAEKRKAGGWNNL